METLQKLRSLELYLAAHPDCEVNSECADRLYDVQELLKEIPDNSHQLEKLESDKEELLEALKKCWEIIPLDSRKWNNVFLEVDSLIKKMKQ